MPAIPKVVHFIWYGSKIEKLQKENLAKCKLLNTNYDVILWIDGQSMFVEETTAYSGTKKLGAKVDANVGAAVTQGTAFNPAKLTRKHEKFLNSTGVSITKGPIGELAKFCEGHGIQLKFADLIYNSMAECANIIHFEKVVRGGNLGAASDILRVELLLRQGGIYCDHDTKFLRAFGEIQAKHGILFGVTQNVMSNAVLAATPDHPALKIYRANIFKTYQDMFADPVKLKSFFNEKKAAPDQLATVQSEFERGTLDRTGPSAMRVAHMNYRESTPDLEVLFVREFWFPKNMVGIDSAKSWL